MIHSVDNIKLATEIDKRALAVGKVIDILIEVNIGREESKGGVLREELDELVSFCFSLSGARLRGFMAIPPPALNEDLDYNDNEDNDESVSADEDYGYKRTPNITSVPRSGKVLNIPATTRLQVIVFKAERFNDVVEIADHFKSKKAIVLNLDNTNKDVANRLIDFLAGVAYAADGELKRIANTSYILVPYNVDISGDLLEELGGDIMQ